MRLKYQGHHFDPHVGSVGVFEIVNGTKLRMISSYGVFGWQEGDRWVYQPRDAGHVALLGTEHFFDAGSTNTFRVAIPTNGGPYRLMLVCIQEQALDTNVPRSQVASLVQGLPIPPDLKARALGFENPVSQEFMGVFAQHDGATNGSQPVRPATNRTSAATGSNR